jgi:hypothetical protein
MSCYGGQRNDSCMHAVLANWGALKLTWLCFDSMANDCRLVSLWQLIALFVAVFWSLELSRFSFSVLLSMDFSPHNLFSNMSFGCPNLHSVWIQFSLDSKIWELRPLWVSVVHGWAGVAGHLAESLSRISGLRFSLLSIHSSFDGAGTCSCYFGIWKHWSKHPT